MRSYTTLLGTKRSYTTLLKPGIGVLGAVSKAKVEDFFIGTNKYVRNSKPTNIYPKPGDASIQTIPAYGNMGKVVGVNAAGTWGKLDNGNWIFLEDSMYTVVLTTPPPTSITDAVGREVTNLAQFSLGKLMPYILLVGGGLFALNLAQTYILKKTISRQPALAGPGGSSMWIVAGGAIILAGGAYYFVKKKGLLSKAIDPNNPSSQPGGSSSILADGTTGSNGTDSSSNAVQATIIPISTIQDMKSSALAKDPAFTRVVIPGANPIIDAKIAASNSLQPQVTAPIPASAVQPVTSNPYVAALVQQPSSGVAMLRPVYAPAVQTTPVINRVVSPVEVAASIVDSTPDQPTEQIQYNYSNVSYGSNGGGGGSYNYNNEIEPRNRDLQFNGFQKRRSRHPQFKGLLS